ncbi:hypothetical protein RHGRI_032566 [Rhododendron griersonianum]|uniref:Uncharacterized protein n=1 Tax=Rhododendron griersonianum TaxID=479676 RepID=A0AAV6II48_9ERIC|nr:hypothetical protein RHGRI_032566 [Rhododendron griersonianum]
MAGARNSLRVVRMLVETGIFLRKSERKLRRQKLRVVARKNDKKVAKEQYSSACRDVLRLRNRLNKKIAAVKRSKTLDQLIARKADQKFAEDHLTSSCSDLKLSRDRLNEIAAVKRSIKEGLDRLILELSSFPIITVSSDTEVITLLDFDFGSAYTLSISGCPLGEIEYLRQFCIERGFDLKE